MAACREKSAAMFPKERPDAFDVRLRHFERRQFASRKEFKFPLAVRRRYGLKLWLHFEQKQQPVALLLVSALGDNAGEMQVRDGDFPAHFLPGFAAGAFVGRFANFRMQFSAAGTPKPEIGLLRALH